jgi:hypothetical protein
MEIGDPDRKSKVILIKIWHNTTANTGDVIKTYTDKMVERKENSMRE